MADHKTKSGNNNKGTSLNEFLEVSKNFIDTMTSQLIIASGKDDDVYLMKSHIGALKEQFGSVCRLVLSGYKDSNSEIKKNIDSFIEYQSVTTLAKNATETVVDITRNGIFGNGFFSWIESNIEEIKKIITLILELIFGSLPNWVGKLLQIIDQIVKLILGLFGGVLGRNRSRIMSELSTMEVEFWNELGAYSRFSAIQNSSSDEYED